MNVAEMSLQMLLLMPVSFVSATAVAYFVPRAGAVELAPAEGQHMQPGKFDDSAIICCLRAVARFPIVVSRALDGILFDRISSHSNSLCSISKSQTSLTHP